MNRDFNVKDWKEKIKSRADLLKTEMDVRGFN